jgi:hypothetical protein
MSHNLGIGSAAVCLQPLVGDTYASSLRDFVAYYRQLGFDQFYTYLLDPGPETIAILRELNLHDGFFSIRWTLPKEWFWQQGSQRMDPRDWDIEGIPQLSDEEEYKYGYSGSDPPKIASKIW